MPYLYNMALCVSSSHIVIRNIRFPTREIDVLSGLVNGRSAKSIALLLSISPKTVETHIRNIMLKLECNSKEQILDFIEKSGHHRDFHQHYQDLLENTALEKILTKSSQRCHNNERACFVVCLLQQASSVKCCRLVDHLKKAGLKVTHLKQIPQNFKNCNLILISNSGNTQDFISQFSENEQKPIIVVSKNRLELSVLTINVQDSYSKSILKILDIFYPYKIIQEDVHSLQSYLPTHPQPLAFARTKFLYHFNNYSFWKKTLRILGLFLCFYISILLFKESPQTFRQDLQVISEEYFLKRPQLIKKMDMILKNQKGLQTLVLIGPGGSGKTTLARYYARQQKARVIFEINAETAMSRTEGLTNFARFLAHATKLKEKFCFIQAIENAQGKERHLLHFIQFNLKNLKSWCLLFDNVEHFQDIRHIFPSDNRNWGDGKIILTTRNGNIKNVAQITPSRTLYMEELNEDDCFVLFNKIYYNQLQPKLEKGTEIQIRQFLKQIPSFPLDISAAAH